MAHTDKRIPTRVLWTENWVTLVAKRRVNIGPYEALVHSLTDKHVHRITPKMQFEQLHDA